MERIQLNLADFGAHEVLSRVQLKSVIGGVAMPSYDCKVSNNSDCGGGFSIFTCNADSVEICQQLADTNCASSACCDDVDCR